MAPLGGVVVFISGVGSGGIPVLSVSFAGLSLSENNGPVVVGADWMSMVQPLLVPSTSKPSRRTRILPHESQFGGTRILSLSMTLCFRACFLRSE